MAMTGGHGSQPALHRAIGPKLLLVPVFIIGLALLLAGRTGVRTLGGTTALLLLGVALFGLNWMIGRRVAGKAGAARE